MQRRRTWLLLALVILGIGVAVRFWPIFSCHDLVVAEAWSGDHRHLASVIARDCGATTALAGHVVVSSRQLRLPIGTEQAICVVDDTTGVRVQWVGRDTLLVLTGRGSVFRAIEERDGVRVLYGYR